MPGNGKEPEVQCQSDDNNPNGTKMSEARRKREADFNEKRTEFNKAAGTDGMEKLIMTGESKVTIEPGEESEKGEGEGSRFCGEDQERVVSQALRCSQQSLGGIRTPSCWRLDERMS